MNEPSVRDDNEGPPSVIIIPTISTVETVAKNANGINNYQGDSLQKLSCFIMLPEDERRWWPKADRRAKAFQSLPKYPRRQRSFANRPQQQCPGDLGEEYHGDIDVSESSNSLFTEWEKLSQEVVGRLKELESERWESTCSCSKYGSNRTHGGSVKSASLPKRPSRQKSHEKKEKRWSSASDGDIKGLQTTEKHSALPTSLRIPRRQKSDI
mgnify:CR=1 FL=1